MYEMTVYVDQLTDTVTEASHSLHRINVL